MMHDLMIWYVLISLGTVVSAGEWSYLTKHRKGPQTWNDNYSECGGVKQSPINIETSQVAYNKELGNIRMTGYDVSPNGDWSITNNGHSVSVSLPQGTTMEGGGLDGTFEAASFHFHWGRGNELGSEHTVDGHKYPLELHIVHYNKKYNDLGGAVNKENGLAVLGVFIEVGDFNPRYRDITNTLSKVQRPGVKEPMTPISLRPLLPRTLNNYYRYDGSLTTPPCFETVTWTVFAETVKISQEQMDAFRALQYESDPAHPDPMVDNFRPPQPIGDRVVKTSQDDSRCSDDSSGENWLMIAAVAVVFFIIGGVSSRTKSIASLKKSA